MTETNEKRTKNEAASLDKILTEKGYLTAIEAFTLLSILYLTRKKHVLCLTVNEISRYLGRSEGRTRAILHEMKRKGVVVDVDHPLVLILREKMSYEQLLQLLPETYTELEEIAGIRINVSRGGRQKCWTLKEVNPLDDKEVVEYLEKKRPELLKVYLPRTAGRIYEEIRERIYRYLGIKDYK